MNLRTLTVCLALAIAGPAATAAEISLQPPPRPVDLVICLDTSGSMSGLIESAKQKLWAVVNDLATANPRPDLRVALYQYGNDSLSSQSGWVQQLTPLTTDLDAVYGKLFALRTNGGTEYVARVVRAATGELDWSADANALRVIFVAGNEPATQDPTYNLQDICTASATKGIIINTIHCGSEQVGRNTGWADAARWADGRFAAVDQDRGTVVINTPHDKPLDELSRALNATYLPFGQRGAVAAAEQVAQDSNARQMSPAAAAARSSVKAGVMYRSDSWDLVDASREKDFDLSAVKTNDLPAAMQAMSPAQREAYIVAQAAERAKIQQQIQDLSVKRSQFIQTEMKRQGLDERQAFDKALRSAVRQQAERKGFQFAAEPTTQPVAAE
jgi:hypothetical protein